MAALCAELSLTASPVCTIWKAEHGGVGGYLVYRDGYEGSASSTFGNYAFLLVEGIEKTFGKKLKVAESARQSLIESVLVHAPACYRLDERGLVRLEPGESQAAMSLIPSDLEIETVLPFDETM